MPMRTKQRQIFEQGAHPKMTQEFVTIGTVVDTNDPQQMGRVRVVCPQWGDSWNTNVEDLPWAIYVTPFGGQVQVGTRGAGIQESQGGLAYGMWAIPKIGAQAVVMCLDGNPMTRMYFGCIYDQFTPHTMPHGRFMYDDHPELEKGTSDAKPFGPYTSAEKFIQPLADNLRQAFGNKSEKNYEFHSRGADHTVTRVDVSQLDQTYSKVQDDKDIKYDDWTSTQGYQLSRINPFSPSSYTDKNYDPLTYCITSPGFHSLSMDDRQENCRIRMRTTAGHQIIMDDTNERIYVATAKGNNWIEMDQDGNIDIFTTNKLSVHANKEINFTSDDTIRMYAKKGIHMYSEDEIRMQAKKDISVKTTQSIRAHADQNASMQAGLSVNVLAGTSLLLTGSTNVEVNASSNVNIQGGTDINLLAGSNLKLSSSHFNNSYSSVDTTCGPINGCSPSAASSASTSASASEQPAFWTDRVPDHEPYARVMTKTDFTHDPEFPYDDPSVNRVERGRTINRSMFWRR